MQQESNELLELVLNAVMQTENDPMQLATRLKSELSDERVSAVIFALLSADKVIAETFNGSLTGKQDAELARSFALILAEASEAVEKTRGNQALRLSDLAI